jgi:EpsI family protein
MLTKRIATLWCYLLLGCLFLMVSGATHRLMARKLAILSESPPVRNVPFSGFPYTIGPWVGSELPLSETVVEVAGNDDYLSRRYVNAADDMEVTLYLAYTSTPVNMEGHRPQVCYVGSGWIHEGTDPLEIEPVYGPAIQVLMHHFRKPMSSFPEVAVLNYYIVSGQATTDHKAFSGLRYRRIIQSGSRPRYVAQVQISSTSEAAATAFARRIIPLVWNYMPPSGGPAAGEP